MRGVVEQQQLYFKLEPAAFALSEGVISAVLESPIGLQPFTEVCGKIIERHSDWIESLGNPDNERAA